MPQTCGSDNLRGSGSVGERMLSEVACRLIKSSVQSDVGHDGGGQRGQSPLSQHVELSARLWADGRRQGSVPLPWGVFRSSVERSCFHWCTANAIFLNAENCAQACACARKARGRSTSVISCHGDGGCIGVSTRAAGSRAGARRPQRADLGDEVAHQRVAPLGGCLTEVNRDNGVCRQNPGFSFCIFLRCVQMPRVSTSCFCC